MRSIGPLTSEAPFSESPYTVALFFEGPSFFSDTGQPLTQLAIMEVSTGQPPTPEPEAKTGGLNISPIAAALKELQRIERLQPNWDSYGSEPPTRLAIEAASRLIWNVYRCSVYAGKRPAIPYAVVPLSGGGAQLEWRGDGGAIEVEISSEGVFGYLLIRGSEPSREFEERDNVPQLRLMELVLSVI